MSPEPQWSRLRDDLAALHGAALRAADPAATVTRALHLESGRLHGDGFDFALEPASRIWCIAFGKASQAMARAAFEVLEPRLAGAVIAYPHGAESADQWPGSARRFAAGHPLPDEGSLAAGNAALEMLRGVAPHDVVLVLVSGGGSALFEALAPGLTLEELREVSSAVMREGADIVELNTVRRALSRTKAGGLARACGAARVITLVLSDVVGDRLESIASGPTIDVPASGSAARLVLERRGLAARFPGVMAALDQADASRDAGRGERRAVIVGSNRVAAEAVCGEARTRGFTTLLLTHRLEGEAREVGRVVGGIVRSVREIGSPVAPPACLVFGGETTVTVRGNGRGGRNLELALGAALAIDGCPAAAVFSFATDGLDGSSGAAGAFATGETISRALGLGLLPHRVLADNDSESFFASLGDLWITGPSGTNVNDLVVALAY